MQVFRTASSAIAAIALFGWLGGCATLSRGAANRSGTEQATVRVTNDGWSDMTVYAVVGGTPWRIGFVSGHTSETFKLPQGLLADAGGGLELLARPIAGRAYLIPTVQVSAGQVVALTLENEPAFARIVVSPR